MRETYLERNQALNITNVTNCLVLNQTIITSIKTGIGINWYQYRYPDRAN